MTELKRCPFCGGAVTIANYGAYLSIISKGTDPKVSCRCRLFMESEQFAEDDAEARKRTKESLVEKWNRRANPWHTGTPTEEGWYLVQYEDIDKTFFVAWSLERFGEELRPRMPQGTVAWQRIEPYKEKNNGKISD